MIMPVTPRLEHRTLEELFALLTTVDFPQVGQNSVAMAITSALGSEPRTQEYVYDEPYPQLPWVKVTSHYVDNEQASIELHATYDVPEHGEIRLKARYYLSGVSEWRAKECDLVTV